MDFNKDFSIQAYRKSLFTHMMGNILVCLSLMLKGSSSVVRGYSFARQDFLCSMHVERSEQTIPTTAVSYVSMDGRANHTPTKTFPVASQMMPCETCDLSHLLFPQFTVPFDCTSGLSVTLSCYQYCCCYSLVYPDPYSVCYHT